MRSLSQPLASPGLRGFTISRLQKRWRKRRPSPKTRSRRHLGSLGNWIRKARIPNVWQRLRKLCLLAYLDLRIHKVPAEIGFGRHCRALECL
jgi:hypothetical protein